MYKFIVLVGSLLITACSAQIAINDISFHDAQGVAYQSSSAGKIIKKNYNLDSLPVIIVLATRDVRLPIFISQLSNVNMLNAEEYEYLLVIANTKSIDSSGYYTRTEQAESVLKGSDFKITIIDGQGNRVVESPKALGVAALKKHLTSGRD